MNAAQERQVDDGDKAAKSSPPPLAGGGRGEGANEHRPARSATLLSHARSLRHDATPAERRLWAAIRDHQVGGLKFRRQVPLERYIADFYCPTAKLVIELDGISHIDSQTDAARDAWMQAHGLRVLRFTNADVLGNLAGVVTAIREFLRGPPPPNPLPQGEGESSLLSGSAAPHV